MIELDYSLVIDATDEPDYFGFYSPELEGFTGIGHSVEDCLSAPGGACVSTWRSCARRGFPSLRGIRTRRSSSRTREARNQRSLETRERAAGDRMRRFRPGGHR